ncbi:hypothetical protein I307_01535 [Cryptococcus deuterogattii 99/473]|uniref:Uncharacterized protein n=1 Tax=Cryptococcus deuterogattii Ram5 TaxID=1296110 RepID=A0A0D0TUV1_9TREE|nr:hypothetical protein I309_01695 [Cryptococcus deuterogattii LA55]KIR39653.1 hypothetical protein I313_04679 [Cryptococcus deuterogattii Ram5]KIR93480.1 hypothetical protein I304_03149 [Cryptococcus deuterogattii CBS 10090]KIR99256.1 hypothetical protein L804_02881 [Cryptococcus deuterogattii 2001/935-1]KIY59283.1 hypothetical protein I307_01535 [Cryptococcus deuterogattii 99/473]
MISTRLSKTPPSRSKRSLPLHCLSLSVEAASFPPVSCVPN